MSTSTPITPAKEIERTYLVELIPLDGPDDGKGVPYDARRVRLRYTVDEADALDARSDRALREALKRALRLEAKEFESGDAAKALDEGGITAALSVFDGHVRYVGGSLVDYLPRSRPRPTRGAR